MSKVRFTSAGSVGAAHQVAQDVADRDRLDPGAHPAGGDHHRQPLGEVAQHLEGQRPGPDHGGGAQCRGRDAAGQQDLADLGPGAQVLAEVVVVGQATEVDDALHPGLPGGRGERAGDRLLGALEVRARADRVDQVVGDLDAGHCPGQRLGIRGITDGHLDVVVPRQVAQPVRVPGQDADPVAGGQQLGHQPSADVAGGAGDQAEAAVRGVHGAQSAGRARAGATCGGPGARDRATYRGAPPPTGGGRPGRHRGAVRVEAHRPGQDRHDDAVRVEGALQPLAQLAGQRDLLRRPEPCTMPARRWPRPRPPRRRRTSADPASSPASPGRCTCRCRPRSRPDGPPRGRRRRTPGSRRRPSSSPGTGWPPAGSRRCARTRRRPLGRGSG